MKYFLQPLLICIVTILLMTEGVDLLIVIETPRTRKIGFGLMTYSEESVGGAIELLEKIYSEHNCFIMHFDQKTPVKSIIKFIKLYPKVHVTPNQYSIEWGSFAIVRAQLDIARINCEYDHLIYLDGSSYPLRPLKDLEKQIHSIPINYNIVFGRDDADRSMPSCKKDSPSAYACGRSGARCMDSECTKYTNTPNNGPLYNGPQWIILSKQFVNYLFTNETDYLDPWINFFESQYNISDEAFFQTLLLNSPLDKFYFAFKVEWMLTVWKDCRSEFNSRSVVGYSPCTLGLNDFEPHIKDSKALFVRKIPYNSPLKLKISESYTKIN
eukprot:NODE_584_length_6418_cov_0.079601.p2 type:complete len:326 gc:universal NODE_584_length_6418_cov_0.079601:222-1199(+)